MRSYTDLASVFAWPCLPFYSPCAMMKLMKRMNGGAPLKSVYEVFRLAYFASVVIVAARKLKVQDSCLKHEHGRCRNVICVGCVSVSSLAREIALRKLICIWLNLDWGYYFPVCGDPGKGSRVIVN